MTRVRAGQSIHGMTLVEVLIAATILFATITIVSDAYRGSLAADLRARRVAELLAPTPLIVARVQSDIRLKPQPVVEGRGVIAGVNFAYRASSREPVPPPPRFDAEFAEFVVYEPRFRLYDVRLTLTSGSISREFTYRELAWDAATPKT